MSVSRGTVRCYLWDVGFETGSQTDEGPFGSDPVVLSFFLHFIQGFCSHPSTALPVSSVSTPLKGRGRSDRVRDPRERNHC